VESDTGSLDQENRRAERSLRGTDDLREVHPRERALQAQLEAARASLAAIQEQSALYARDLREAYDLSVARATALEEAYLQTAGALAAAVEARDAYTGGHVERVRLWSVAVGRVLGWQADELRQLEFGAVLHDIGKIGVPDAILLKPGPLDEQEWLSMRRHPEIGAQLMKRAAFLDGASAGAEFHHERYDGKGYPRGLAGDAIPIVARVVAVADAYDAMVTTRPYRAALPEDAAMKELRRGAGTQFDPLMVEAFLTARRTVDVSD
jgi:HD-GYP domain-containing protein (c-di-GMP phosphodiesterase class II)